MLFNYTLGTRLYPKISDVVFYKKVSLLFGIICNLALLSYFKYANFFIDNLNVLFHISYELPPIILPLAISFFTFQQIAYLVDAYKGETKEYNFLHYSLFVTFFPQLIAGPIVHHKEMLPQFAKDKIYSYRADDFAIGMTIFFFGLFKKVVLADGISIYATPVFVGAETGHTLTFVTAWLGALSYTFQLYFDFSGYSDMAIGLARLFGVTLPINFNSPYKASSISEFWNRWHMTLSRFLRDYVYIPLGGNRRGTLRCHINLMVTMLLGGFWHGAGWTFIIWGALHGAYLIIGKIWGNIISNFYKDDSRSVIYKLVTGFLTFIAVVIGWVFFRSESTDSAILITNAMFGQNGFVLPENYLGYLNKFWNIGIWLEGKGVKFEPLQFYSGLDEVFNILVLGIIVWIFPNTQEIMSNFNRGIINNKNYSIFKLRWSPRKSWALFTSFISIYALIKMSGISEFLYYQF